MIIRTVKTNRYSVIANAILQDDRLSYSARGIAACMLSKPDGWRIREENLYTTSPDSRGVVRRAEAELQEHGYLHRRRYQDGRGRWQHDVALYEEPHTCDCDNPECRNWHAPTVGSPTAGRPAVGFPTVGEAPVIEITEEKNLREKTERENHDPDRDPSFSLKERATALTATATASDSTPPTITVTELTNEQPDTATASTQQAEIDACLLAYYDNGGRALTERERNKFTTQVRSYTGAAFLRALTEAVIRVDHSHQEIGDRVNVHYLAGVLRNMAAEGKLNPTTNQVDLSAIAEQTATPFDQAALDAEMERTAAEREAKRKEREAENERRDAEAQRRDAERREQERIRRDNEQMERQRRHEASAAERANRERQDMAKRIAACIVEPDQAGRIADAFLRDTTDAHMRGMRLDWLTMKHNQVKRPLAASEATAILHGGLNAAAPARVAA